MRSSLRAAAAPVLAACALLATACIPEGRFKLPYNDVPVARPDGWTVATPAEAGFDADRLRRAYERLFSEDELPGARSLLVIRDGRLVAEGYCRDLGDIDRLGSIMSATKSVTSLLVGAALDDGRLYGVGQTLAELLPDKVDGDPRKRGITLEHLLTMRSGLDFSNTRFSLEIEHGEHDDGVRYTLGRGLVTTPGERFDYKDADPFLVGAALERATGTTLEAFARERLLGPLGISDLRWLAAPGGPTYGAFGLHLRPRDLAKIGQLAMQAGQWQGRALVSEAWLARSTTAHVSEAETKEGLYGYGYYWWVAPDGKAFLAWGHGGQFVYVARERRLVVVVTAEPDAAGRDAAVNRPQLMSLVELIEAAIVR